MLIMQSSSLCLKYSPVYIINNNISRAGTTRLCRNVRIWSKSGTTTKPTNISILFSMNLILSLQQQKTIKALQFYFDEIGR